MASPGPAIMLMLCCPRSQEQRIKCPRWWGNHDSLGQTGQFLGQEHDKKKKVMPVEVVFEKQMKVGCAMDPQPWVVGRTFFATSPFATSPWG